MFGGPGIAGLLAPKGSMTLPTDTTKKPGLFGQGGTGWGILGILGDVLAASGGRQGVFGPQILQHRQQERERGHELEDYDRKRRDTMADQMELLKWKRANPEPSSLQTNVNYVSSLPEGSPQRELAERGLPGARFDPEIMAAIQAQQEELIRQRAAAQSGLAQTRSDLALRNKQAPGAGGGGGGRGGALTANQRAKMIGDAKAAIAKGANPAAVKARLAELGVQ